MMHICLRLQVLAMTSRLALDTFDSFCAADEATRREYWLMSMEQRLEILEQLRMQAYPDGQTAPRLQRVLESVAYSPR